MDANNTSSFVHEIFRCLPHAVTERLMGNALVMVMKGEITLWPNMSKYLPTYTTIGVTWLDE